MENNDPLQTINPDDVPPHPEGRPFPENGIEIDHVQGDPFITGKESVEFVLAAFTEAARVIARIENYEEDFVLDRHHAIFVGPKRPYLYTASIANDDSEDSYHLWVNCRWPGVFRAIDRFIEMHERMRSDEICSFEVVDGQEQYEALKAMRN